MLTALTGMRGLAAWWVVVFHFHEIIPLHNPGSMQVFIEHGYLAVDLFFVLSGFIICLNYLSGFEVFAWRTYLRFLVLRLGRIYPLHLFMMFMYLLNPLAILFASHAHYLGARYGVAYFAMSLFLVQNWGFTDTLAWNVPAWSISTEWFAYLIFPGLAILAQFASTIPRAVFGILASLLLLTAVSTFVAPDISANGLYRCVLEFTAGGAVYTIWKRQGTVRRIWGQIAEIASIILAGCAMLLPVLAIPTAALAWCGLIYGLADKRSIFARFLSSRWIYLAGEYSYSTYLVHYFVRDWVKFLLVDRGMPWLWEIAAYMGATAVGSVVLYWLVEVPGRDFVRRLVDRSRPAISPTARGR